MASFLGISLLLVFFFLSFSSWRVVDGIPGGRTKVKDVKNNKEIQDLGRFSVKEYNKDPSYYHQGQGQGKEGPLEFKEVAKAETQVVAGMKYYLTISVSQGGVPKTYDAVVVVQPWVHPSKQLLTFTPSTN